MLARSQALRAKKKTSTIEPRRFGLNIGPCHSNRSCTAGSARRRGRPRRQSPAALGADRRFRCCGSRHEKSRQVVSWRSFRQLDNQLRRVGGLAARYRSCLTLLSSCDELAAKRGRVACPVRQHRLRPPLRRSGKLRTRSHPARVESDGSMKTHGPR